MQQRALWTTLIATLASIGVLATLGWVDVGIEEQAALEDFAEDQAIIAGSLAEQLAERLHGVAKDAALIAEANQLGHEPSMKLVSSYTKVRLRRADEPPLSVPPPSSSFIMSVPVPEDRVVELVLPPATLLATVATFDRQPSQALLVLAPGESKFRAANGRRLAAPPLAEALAAGAASLRLPKEWSAHLGLPARISVAGLAMVDAGELGRWGVAAVVSAERLRDREERARTRVVFGVLTAGALVAAFGALAFRRQRRELELGRELAVAAVERQHEARLDQAARAATLGTLAMGIAHEISTPASVIQGRAEQLAARVGDDERGRAAVSAIAHQAERISEVVRGFLDLARGNARPAELVDAAAIVAGAIDLVEHRFAKAGVAVRHHVGLDLPRVRGDQRLLEHAVTNLLLNACDASAPRGTVEVTAAPVDGMVEIVVSDEGAGIAAQHASHVMEPFFTTKPAGKGTGLGLAITSEIVRAHRGVLRLENRAPRGTRAIIALPVTETQP